LAAVVLGLAAMMIPLVALASIRESFNVQSNTFSEQFKSLEGSEGAVAPKYSEEYQKDFGFLFLSFAVSLLGYVFFRRRRSGRDYRTMPYLY
jgi:hypothetical protein